MCFVSTTFFQKTLIVHLELMNRSLVLTPKMAKMKRENIIRCYVLNVLIIWTQVSVHLYYSCFSPSTVIYPWKSLRIKFLKDYHLHKVITTFFRKKSLSFCHPTIWFAISKKKVGWLIIKNQKFPNKTTTLFSFIIIFIVATYFHVYFYLNLIDLNISNHRSVFAL